MVGEAPLVRLRVRTLRRVDDEGQRRSQLTVFCPTHLRSIDVETCKVCARIASVAEEAIECTPAPSDRPPGDLRDVLRLGADACVGDAMGHDAVAVDANLTVEPLLRGLADAGAIVGIVVDEEGRLLGLVDAADVAGAARERRAYELARPITPVLESAPLAEAVLRMVHERSRALPVVDDEGQVVALLTDLDALRWVARRSRAP
jgi:CBS domain-containing protein